MRAPPSQRRYQRWFALLVVLVMLVAVPVALAAHRYQQGVAGECALRFAADKARLDDDRHHWNWWPPGWVCAFEGGEQLTQAQPIPPGGLLRKVDCVQIPVPDLDDGLAFYRDRLGHELVWRTESAAGLRLADSDSELVLHIQRPLPEVDFLVGSVDQAAAQLIRAGGTLVVEPVDIPVGRVAVVADPFGNPLTILDLSKGRYRTDADGNVTGVAAADEAAPDER